MSLDPSHSFRMTKENTQDDAWDRYLNNYNPILPLGEYREEDAYL